MDRERSPATDPVTTCIVSARTAWSRWMEQQDDTRVSATYLQFAEEVGDRSPLYVELSRGVAFDPEVIGFLLTMPREKQRPNLFFPPPATSSGRPPAGISSGAPY
jgi:hypothetical protein